MPRRIRHIRICRGGKGWTVNRLRPVAAATVGRKKYSDPFFELEETEEEDSQLELAD